MITLSGEEPSFQSGSLLGRYGAHRLQIGSIPERKGAPPRQPEKPYGASAGGNLQLIVSKTGRESSIAIHPDADLWLPKPKADERIAHTLAAGRHAWVHGTEGPMTLNGHPPADGDGAGLTGEPKRTLSSTTVSQVVLYDLNCEKVMMTDKQLMEALQWRYATKAFDPNRRISAATWNTLQEALVLSASSFGLQPYKFIIVHDPATRAKLMPHAWGQRQVVDASHFVVFAARRAVTEAEIDRFLDRIVAVRGGNREALACYRQMMTGSLLGDEAKARIPHWTARQCYIALGTLLTSAALLGVDACPMEGFVPAEFDTILGLPAQGYAAVVCCALGYRSADDTYARAAKVRFPATELVMNV